MDSRPILLVENTSDDVALMMRAFRQSGLAHDVVVARDGADALDYLQGTGPFAARDTRVQPALILLDLKLPRLSGQEVLRRMQADPELSRLRVVVLSSSGEEEQIAESYALGACSYVRKPAEYHDFLATVQRLGEYWLRLNEAAPVGQPA